MSSDHDQPGAARRELPTTPEPTTTPPSVDSPFSEAEALGAITDADIAEAELAEQAAARAAASAAAAADVDLADAPAEGDAEGAATDTETVAGDEVAGADAAAEDAEAAAAAKADEAAADANAAETAEASGADAAAESGATAADVNDAAAETTDAAAEGAADVNSAAAWTVAPDEIAGAATESEADETAAGFEAAAAAETTADVDAAERQNSADQSATDFAASGATPADAVADEPPAVAKDTETPARTSRITATPRSGETDLSDAGPAVETIVHVLRHGEVHNPKGILYGRLPGFSLSVTGRAQAGAVARALSDHDIAAVIASPLQRAQETAGPIAEQHGVIVRTDENLIEAGNTFEGLRVSVGDGALRKPRHWWKLRDPFTPSWGEPYLQIAHRMLAAVNKARVEAAGREAVLVSHQLPVWTLRRFLQGQRLWHDPRARQCSLASLTSLVYQGDTLVDIVYSEPAGGSDPTVHGA